MITSDSNIEIQLPDLNATELFGARIAAALKRGVCIYLNGDLGAGKTTLARAILRSLGFAGTVKSPTYTLVEAYNCVNFKVYHFDLYRLQTAHELEDIGIRDYATSEAVLLFEWAAKGLGLIPAADIEINLHATLNDRYAVCIANTTVGTEVLNKLH